MGSSICQQPHAQTRCPRIRWTFGPAVPVLLQQSRYYKQHNYAGESKLGLRSVQLRIICIPRVTYTYCALFVVVYQACIVDQGRNLAHTGCTEPGAKCCHGFQVCQISNFQLHAARTAAALRRGRARSARGLMVWRDECAPSQSPNKVCNQVTQSGSAYGACRYILYTQRMARPGTMQPASSSRCG